jgi:hypothetical protein
MKRDFKGVWIPKEIWLDSSLTWMEKLFIVEINSLDNEESCYASNSYLGKFFNLSNGRVSQIIKSLIEKQYVSAEYEMEGKEVKKRYLRILNTGIKNIKQGGIKYSKGGYLENDKDNNTVFNNTINNKKHNDEIEDFFESIWRLYPRKEGKGSISLNQKKKLYDIGIEHMTRVIERYNDKIRKENIEKKYIKQGSTFFKTGYIDYLDENFGNEEKERIASNSMYKLYTFD